MKMKIPKKIKMFGYDWKIIAKKDNNHASWNWDTLEIVIPRKFWQEEIIHEIAEATLTHLQFRFSGIEGGMEYQFLFNHTGLCQFAKTFYQILRDNNLLT